MIYYKSVTAENITFDNSENGFSSTSVQDAIIESKSSGVYYATTATSSITTSSGSFSQVGSMSVTPVAGTYLCIFSADIDVGSVNGHGAFQFFNGDSPVTGSLREFELEVALLLGIIGTTKLSVGASCFFALITSNGVDPINVRYRSVDGQTVRVLARSLFALKVA